MKKPVDAVSEFVNLRDAILAERQGLVARLREIDEALGSGGLYGRSNYFGPRAGTPRQPNSMSLKEAVFQVIEGKALTKHEILDAVLEAGYKFSTIDPLNSLGVLLYGHNPEFKRNRGKFSL